jgi:hypothetical protein
MKTSTSKIKALLIKYKISPDEAFHHLPFLAFITCLIVLNIGNGYVNMARLEKIQNLQKETKELRWQAIDLESTMLSQAKESQISQSVTSLNLEVSKKVPKTIVIP